MSRGRLLLALLPLAASGAQAQDRAELTLDYSASEFARGRYTRLGVGLGHDSGTLSAGVELPVYVLRADALRTEGAGDPRGRVLLWVLRSPDLALAAGLGAELPAGSADLTRGRAVASPQIAALSRPDRWTVRASAALHAILGPSTGASRAYSHSGTSPVSAPLRGVDGVDPRDELELALSGGASHRWGRFGAGTDLLLTVPFGGSDPLLECEVAGEFRPAPWVGVEAYGGLPLVGQRHRDWYLGLRVTAEVAAEAELVRTSPSRSRAVDRTESVSAIVPNDLFVEVNLVLPPGSSAEARYRSPTPGAVVQWDVHLHPEPEQTVVLSTDSAPEGGIRYSSAGGEEERVSFLWRNGTRGRIRLFIDLDLRGGARVDSWLP